MNVWKRELVNQDGVKFGEEWAVQTRNHNAAIDAVAQAMCVSPDDVEFWQHNGGNVWDQFSVSMVNEAPAAPGFCPECHWVEMS